MKKLKRCLFKKLKDQRRNTIKYIYYSWGEEIVFSIYPKRKLKDKKSWNGN